MRLLYRRWLLAMLMALIAGLGLSAAATPGRPAVVAGASVWGEPCLPWHPPACYTGSNELDAGADLLPAARLVSSLAAASQYSDPTAVELLCFDAQGTDAVIEIEWETGTEFDTRGFYLMRGDVEDGSFNPISEFIYNCDDGGMVGGYYFFKDFAVMNGQTYYYRLQEITSDDESIYYPALNEPPISAVAGLPTAVDTLTPSLTPTPTWTLTSS